ncbi:MAG: NrfD/PsrC family molybdoenzyme membrane anchor subunit [candidate division NC10 bacterium]
MRTNAAYHQLIADLGATFRPQRTWVEGRGLFLIAGHFLSSVAAGGWLFALWWENRPAALAAFAAGVLAAVAHLLFLGRPERFWRMFHAQRSWIARGFLGTNAFLAGAACALAFPGTSLGRLGVVLSVAGAVLLIVYKGNVYAASRGVPFWNSPVLPVLYATYAIRGGLALHLVLAPLAGGGAGPGAELIELWVAVSAAVMLGFYLTVMRGAGLAARASVGELTRGRVAVAFYLGTVGAGLIAPIALGLSGVAGTQSAAVLAFVGALSLGGDFFAKYTIAKAGIYVPLMPAGRA